MKDTPYWLCMLLSEYLHHGDERTENAPGFILTARKQTAFDVICFVVIGGIQSTDTTVVQKSHTGGFLIFFVFIYAYKLFPPS